MSDEPGTDTARPRWRRWLLRAALAVVALLLLGVGALLVALAPLGAAYQGKILAAGVFVSGREADAVLAEDLTGVSPLLDLCSSAVDREGRRVRSTAFGLLGREVVFRPGLGTTVAIGEVADVPVPAPVPAGDPAVLWPEGERVDLAAVPADAGARLAAALDDAFAEPDAGRPRRTRSVVVVHRGRIVAERYAPGFGPSTPQLGWSVTKTVVAALAGALVRDGRWALDRAVPVPEWQATGDPRGAITLERLLEMQTGLSWTEVYSPRTDVTAMLFESRDAGAYAADKPLAHPIGGAWAYSSGTTNIICRALRLELGATASTFPRDALFAPLGMSTALVELDASGTPIGSSFGWASARDWARFGLLWAQDGVWQGKRLLPEGWVERCRRPAEHSDGRYGAHVWLDLQEPGAPDLPADAFHMAGHDCQFVTVVPSKQLVVVRTGLTRHRRAWSQDRLAAACLAALPAADSGVDRRP